MLHELLMAMHGHCGGLFKDTESGIQVVKNVPFIHPAEEKSLHRLCILATYFKKLTDFIRLHSSPSGVHTLREGEEVNCNGLHGLYLKAFCRGLDSVLDEYRDKLITLEQDVLKDPHLGLFHIQCQLDKYCLLFPALNAVVEQITVQKAHGCYILEIVHKNSASGLPLVQSTLKSILSKCNGLLFKQLCGWTLHGLLTDRYKEFFIQQTVDVCEDYRQDAEDNTSGGNYSTETQQLMLDDSSFLSKPGQYVLRADLLPSYIPTRVANKILFVGESIQMFQQRSAINSEDVFQRKGGLFDKSVEQKFAHELLQLSLQGEFCLMKFEATIDEIRVYVAERLWTLVVEDSCLISHLQIIKDFFLLGRGELYLAFIDRVQDLLSGIPTGTTEHDVNKCYLQAAGNVLITDEALLQRFHLTVKLGQSFSKNKQNKPKSVIEQEEDMDNIDQGWRSLGLEYHVQWPLHILFTPGVLDRYNTVFQFLLAVKRTQLQLQKSWMVQMQGKDDVVKLQDRAKWKLRTHMAFFVDNLQYYLQVDVIESLFSILLEKINSTRDFEVIKLAHDQFVASLLAQCFVHMKPVSQCMTKLLSLCTAYCHLVHNCEGVMTKAYLKSMEVIAKRFQWQSGLLFKLLSSVRDNSSSPHLAQLLLRLDYNRYFTSAGGQLGQLGS